MKKIILTNSVKIFIAFLFIINASTNHLSTAWTLEFEPEGNITIEMETIKRVNVTITGLNVQRMIADQSEIHIRTAEAHHAEAHKIIKAYEILPDATWRGDFELHGVFLGKTEVYGEMISNQSSSKPIPYKTLDVIVIREVRTIDHIFTGSVAALVSILYINFGAALDVPKLKTILRRPIGPAIGFFGQFLIMPLLSFFLGKLIFPNSYEMQLGMFFTGVSPAGGASNIWTVLLGGNLDLSITMTTISTIAAFGMMPLWIFTLGKVIFDSAGVTVPYSNIATYAGALVGPLLLGILIQKFLPKIGRILVRILKPLSALLIIFIVVFAIVTNLYLFELFSWQIVVAGLGLPWLGYGLGWVVAKLCGQNIPDSLTIGIETGIQNTGLSIFLLRFSLEQPEADLTTVIPVSVAIMTPIPLLCLYIYQLIKRRTAARSGDTLLPAAGSRKDPATLNADSSSHSPID